MNFSMYTNSSSRIPPNKVPLSRWLFNGSILFSLLPIFYFANFQLIFTMTEKHSQRKGVSSQAWKLSSDNRWSDPRKIAKVLRMKAERWRAEGTVADVAASNEDGETTAKPNDNAFPRPYPSYVLSLACSVGYCVLSLIAWLWDTSSGLLES